MAKPSFFSIFWAFARHGNVTFGGGSATIAELEFEIVERRGWITRDQSRLSYALSRITPGTNLLAYCVGVGWLLRGAVGAVLCLVGASIPCAALVVLVTAIYEWWSRNPTVSLALHGALIAAVAVTAATGWTLIRPYRGLISYSQIIVGSVGSFVLSLVGVTPLYVLLLGALVGLAWSHGAKKK